MDIINTFLLCSILILCLHFLNTILILNKKNRPRLPPGPTGLPILGSLLAIGNRPHESLAKLAQAHGPLMTVRFGTKKIVVATSADVAKEILRTNDRAFVGRPRPEAVTVGKFHDTSLVWASGLSPHWKKLRRVCNTELFTTQRLDSLVDLRHRMMSKMIKLAERARTAREALHVESLVFGTVLNFLSNTVFSGDMVDMGSSGGTGELRELIARLVELGMKPNAADYLPWLRPFDVQGIRREITPLYGRVHELLWDVIGRRVGERAGGHARRGDFLDVLLHYADAEENGSSQELTHENIMVLFMDLFVAGTHTTTITMEWAMAELLRHPPVLAKLKREIFDINIPPGKLVEEQDIPRILYLDAVIKETLRLHPVIPLLVPHLTEERANIGPYTIPEDTEVLVNVWSIQRDPVYWADSTSFRPERFVGSDVDIRGRDCRFLPFGTGRRICPGLGLAVRMVSLMLANLVHGFDWELPDGMRPEDLDMTDGFGLLLRKMKPLVAIPVSASSQ
ncbi:Cytochrome P450 76C4 [Striga hermonthica]|uniref:Cytochrome P450 76C4 n=1 Tax=Striga hermonthica TaxID=68872 RepID=A0A9N7NYC9_STRHE|nr:Cytochrome P450 76C4 [Striga hermonthica]